MGQVCITETSLIHEEWSPDERNNDWSLDKWNDEGSFVLDGMNTTNGCVAQPQAHFYLKAQKG